MHFRSPSQADSSMLLVSSNRQTVHVFKLGPETVADAAPAAQSWLGWAGSVVAGYVPAVVSGYWTQGLLPLWSVVRLIGVQSVASCSSTCRAPNFNTCARSLVTKHAPKSPSFRPTATSVCTAAVALMR